MMMKIHFPSGKAPGPDKEVFQLRLMLPRGGSEKPGAASVSRPGKPP